MHFGLTGAMAVSLRGVIPRLECVLKRNRRLLLNQQNKASEPIF